MSSDSKSYLAVLSRTGNVNVQVEKVSFVSGVHTHLGNRFKNLLSMYYQ